MRARARVCLCSAHKYLTGPLQVNETVQRAQYEADVDFTTRDSQVWDALPSITTPVLLMAGEQVRGWDSRWSLNTHSGVYGGYLISLAAVSACFCG